MGWFFEQTQQRKRNDENDFQEAFLRISDSITGRELAKTLESSRSRTKSIIGDILRHFDCTPPEVSESFPDISSEIESLCRPCGVMHRSVTLEGGWYRDAFGAYLAVDSRTGEPTALIPDRFSGRYRYYDAALGRHIRVGRKLASAFTGDAILFYAPLPLRTLSARDFFRFGIRQWSVKDFLLPGILTLLATLLGLLVPKLNHFLFNEVFCSQNAHFLFSTVLFLLCLALARLLLSTAQSIIADRNAVRTSLAVEAATMMRTLSMPVGFFKALTSGDIMKRVQYANTLCDILVELFFDAGITAVLSLTYLSQMVRYGKALVAPALLAICATVLFSVVTGLLGMKITRRRMDAAAKENGMAYSLITGVQKIKLSGAEKRAFAQWGRRYAEVSASTYNLPAIFKLQEAISAAISLGGLMLIYAAAVKSGVSVADYYAFDTAYAMVFSAFSSILYIGSLLADIRPTLEMIRPILDTVPEVSHGKKMIDRLSGNIELNNVTFRYAENMPPVINNLSLKIRAGQYVAIVGTTGCGKSTLMRILLGFETPERGAVYYDGQDLSGLDLRSLRQNIGTVMQNGKLFQGDIFSNITVSAPWLTMDEAWEAAEIAGMADDIRRMPMGMQTLISEGGGGISGGQRQRLMIARAVAPQPRILFLDEATSALDNITQKTVSDALDSLNCTRIVIAHRLSTIRHCDRIIFLDGGRIAEDGTYEELIAKNGLFAELVNRQRLDE